LLVQVPKYMSCRHTRHVRGVLHCEATNSRQSGKQAHDGCEARAVNVTIATL
jgi:hypothetical protein